MTRMARFEDWLQKWKARLGKYPLVFAVILLAVGYVAGELRPLSSLIDFFREKQAMQQARQTEYSLKRDLLAELHRNIRVLQFHFWGFGQKWTSDFHIITSALATYVDFVTSHSTRIPEYFGEVRHLGQKFEVAEQKIQAAVKSHPPTVRDRDTDFFRSVINESRALAKRIGDDIGNNTYQTETYLGSDWEREDLLEENSLQFMEREGRNIVTGPSIEWR